MYSHDLSKIDIEKEILKVVIFFDMFDFALTDLDIWKFLEKEIGLDNLKNILKGLEQENKISSKNGFYFINQREYIIAERIRKYNFSCKKLKKARLTAKLFKAIPWIKMIAVSGFKGPHNLRIQSDIDLFIVTDKKRIWVTRFFCTAFMKFLNMRPQKYNKKDKICLSFYVTEDKMNLEKYLLGEKDGHRDLDYIYWLSGFRVIYDSDDTYNKFRKENEWLKKYLPNFAWPQMISRFDAGASFSPFYKDSLDIFLGGAEKYFKKFQIKILPVELANIMNQDTRVVISDEVLKLHSSDKRRECRERFIRKFKRHVG